VKKRMKIEMKKCEDEDEKEENRIGGEEKHE
jgi:hypothetical protein